MSYSPPKPPVDSMSASYRIPDFFIVGAPKCGTTWLATHLGKHPHVFMSPVKEPNYFCFDSTRKRVVKDRCEYEALFAPAPHWQICGEASTSYLFSYAAVPAILDANPRANIIAMVRNPLEMVVSEHAQKLYNLQEHETDFELAWRLSPQRRAGLSVNDQCHDARYLDYQKIGKLGWQIDRLLRICPRRQVHVIVHDDLRSDPRSVYRDALLFLGIRPDERFDFPIVNARKARVSRALAWFMRDPPPGARWLKHAAQRTMPTQTKKLGRILRSLNTKTAAPQQLSPELRREMISYFSDDIDLLGELLNRSLSKWKDKP